MDKTSTQHYPHSRPRRTPGPVMELKATTSGYPPHMCVDQTLSDQSVKSERQRAPLSTQELDVQITWSIKRAQADIKGTEKFQ